MRLITTTRWAALAALLGVWLASPFAVGAEIRTWTNLKGQTIKAELLAVEGEYVRLRTDAGKDYRIERKTLSAGDQRYLVEFGGAAEVAIDPKAKVDMPEKKMRFDSKTLVRRDDVFALPEGFSLEFEITESEHFLVMSSGRVRGKDTAELAERLWYGMNFQHPGFAEKWGDKKKPIFLCGSEEDYSTLGRYYIAQMNAAAQRAQQQGLREAAENYASQARSSAMTWNQVSGATIRLDDETCDKYNVMSSARVFKAWDKRLWRSGVWNPFPTHCLAGDVLRVQMGGGNSTGIEGFFAITGGHSYFKEIQLTGETVTSMVDTAGSQDDEVVKAGGFDDGQKWARTLRSLVKKEKITPTLAELYRVTGPGDLTPETTVLMYSLAQYMQSTPDRLAKFSKFMERVDQSNGRIPSKQEFARIFGFEAADELEADWIEYIKSTAFK